LPFTISTLRDGESTVMHLCRPIVGSFMHNVQKKMRVESTGESENVTLETVAEL